MSKHGIEHRFGQAAGERVLLAGVVTADQPAAVTVDFSVVSIVDYSFTGSYTSPADANDFGGTLPSGSVIFAPGETSKTITVNVSGDTNIKRTEGFTVTGGYPSRFLARPLCRQWRFSMSPKVVARIVVLSLVWTAPLLADDGLRERIKDANGVRTDVWVYNDIGKAMEQARKENKPIFVTFRCVPCKDCAAFDADVANGNDKVRDIAKEKFISVRQVEMKGVDLSLFQFDHDLNWAGMFINADGVVYARYGTQSAEGSDAYNSIDGLVNTMNRVLELHANYPKNADELKGKRGKPKPFKTALEMPGLQNPSKFAQQTERGNCIHCHNIHDAEQLHAKQSGTFSQDLLWRYPLPDKIGLKIDRVSGIKVSEVVADSPAAKAGLKAGEEIVRMNGQRITSIADMQWVLHNIPNTAAEMVLEGSQSGKQTLSLPAGWKKSDISWRGSMWSLSPRLGVWAPNLALDERDKLGIPKTDTALLVRMIIRNTPGGQNAYDAGLREGDVIVAMDGQPVRMTSQQFNAHLKLNYKPGDKLPVTVVHKDGQREEVKIPLAD